MIAVGCQHNHTGFLSALKNLHHDGGIRGLWRGVTASMMRTGKKYYKVDRINDLTNWIVLKVLDQLPNFRRFPKAEKLSTVWM